VLRIFYTGVNLAKILGTLGHSIGSKEWVPYGVLEGSHLPNPDTKVQGSRVTFEILDTKSCMLVYILNANVNEKGHQSANYCPCPSEVYAYIFSFILYLLFFFFCISLEFIYVF